ncbi:MAG: YbjQ family protein [Pirellulales bacterium]
MIVVNIESIPGTRVVSVKGLVQGNTVRAKHVGKDIAAGLKNIVGGELKGYTELLVESRQEAVARMIEQAQALGANAIVNVRFATSSITAGASELYAYGTAVVLAKVDDEALT